MRVAFSSLPEKVAVFQIQALGSREYVRVGVLACLLKRDHLNRPCSIEPVININMDRRMTEEVIILEALPDDYWITRESTIPLGLQGQRLLRERFHFGSLLFLQTIFVFDGDKLCTRGEDGRCYPVFWVSRFNRWCLKGESFPFDRDRIVMVLRFTSYPILNEQETACRLERERRRW